MVQIMNVHDFRRLTVCEHCDEPGDRAHMLRGNLGARWLHGRCFVALNGAEALLALPASDVGRMTLDDIGPELMKGESNGS